MKRKTILLIEDDFIVADLIRRMLEKAEYRVTVLEEGLNLIQNMEVQKPDLVLMDIMLPYENGYELCEKIKSHPTLAPTPVVFITAKSTEADKRRGFDAGAADYFTKPFQVTSVLGRIEEILARPA